MASSQARGGTCGDSSYSHARPLVRVIRGYCLQVVVVYMPPQRFLRSVPHYPPHPLNLCGSAGCGISSPRWLSKWEAVGESPYLILGTGQRCR